MTYITKVIFIALLFINKIDGSQLKTNAGQYVPEDTVETILSRQPLNPTHQMFLKWKTAAENGNLAKIEKLIASIDINGDAHKNVALAASSALIIASRKGHEEIVKRILSIPGINVNLQDVRRNTALLDAVKKRHEAIVQILLQTPNIDVNIPDNVGSTALICAAHQGAHTIVSMLLNAPGINVNKQNQSGATAIMAAAIQKHEHIVRILLRAPGIDINILNNEGRTVLMETIIWFFPSLNIIKSLLDHPGIKLNIKNKMGKTVLMIATADDRADAAITMLSRENSERLRRQTVDDFKTRNTTIGHLIIEKIIQLRVQALTVFKNRDMAKVKSIIDQIGTDAFIYTDLLDKAFATQNIDIIIYLLSNSDDAREMLARFPFESIDPNSDLFKAFFNLAFASADLDNTTKASHDSAPSCANPGCAHPKNQCTQRCSHCKKVYYCSIDCQKADWKVHKTQCAKYI